MATLTQGNGGSATAVMEMEPVHFSSPREFNKSQSALPQPSDQPERHSTQQSQDMTALPPPGTATEAKQDWNYPRSNIAKVAACLWSFTMMGANDAAYGPLIPYIQEYYSLSYLIVSLLFLSPFIGYTASALMNNYIHLKVGQVGVAFICSAAHIAAYIIIANHPPYPVLVVAFSLAGFGNGLADAAWNAWVGNMARANEILGLLHGLYGFGAVLSPLIASSMIAKAGYPWYSFYYMMIGMAALELGVLVTCFWGQDGAAYRASLALNPDSATASIKDALFHRPGARVTWLCSLFLLGYVGTEVSLGGWTVEFMMRVRDGEPFSSGMVATGFWLGIAVGRIVLGFVTPRIGEKLAVAIYLPLAMGCQLLFWLVPDFVVSAVALGLQGFLLGPLFPAAVVAMSKMLPKHLHVGAIGFAAAFGGSGAAILPFAVGAIAQSVGVKVLQPLILGFLGAIFLLWIGLPKLEKKKD